MLNYYVIENKIVKYFFIKLKIEILGIFYLFINYLLIILVFIKKIIYNQYITKINAKIF